MSDSESIMLACLISVSLFSVAIFWLQESRIAGWRDDFFRLAEIAETIKGERDRLLALTGDELVEPLARKESDDDQA